MPDYRASYYFVTRDNEGWSENLYLSAADIDTAATNAAGYIAPRMDLSPDNVDMVYGKVSDMTIKGDSLIITPATGFFPFIGTWTADPVGAYLEANTALLIELLATASRKNRIFLRGLSLDVVTGREYKSPTGYNAKLTALFTWLVANVEIATTNKPVTHPPVYTFAACVAAYLKGPTARKPGRPFSLPVGRKFAHRTV